MPKENINDVTDTHLRVEVSWRPDPSDGTGHVQLATVHIDSPARIPASATGSVSVDEVEVTINGEPAPGVTTGTGRPQMWERLNGWHVTLGREQTNRLIRALRKGRDAAYGPDA